MLHLSKIVDSERQGELALRSHLAGLVVGEVQGSKLAHWWRRANNAGIQGNTRTRPPTVRSICTAYGSENNTEPCIQSTFDGISDRCLLLVRVWLRGTKGRNEIASPKKGLTVSCSRKISLPVGAHRNAGSLHLRDCA